MLILFVPLKFTYSIVIDLIMISNFRYFVRLKSYVRNRAQSRRVYSRAEGCLTFCARFLKGVDKSSLSMPTNSEQKSICLIVLGKQ